MADKQYLFREVARELVDADWHWESEEKNLTAFVAHLSTDATRTQEIIIEGLKNANEEKEQEITELKQAVGELIGQIDSINKKENTPDYRETVVVKRIMKEKNCQEKK